MSSTAVPVNGCPPDTDSATDGRRQRSADSRRRIIEALMELVQAGDLEPRAEAVAERAEVGLRSVFRHFKDMEGLRQEMSGIVEGRLRAMIEQPVSGSTWKERLLALIDRRADVFEQVMPYRRAANAQRHRSPLIQEQNAQLNRFLRTVVTAILPDSFDPSRVEVIDFAMCLDSWIRLRHDQGLSPEDARQVVTRIVEALVVEG